MPRGAADGGALYTEKEATASGAMEETVISLSIGSMAFGGDEKVVDTVGAGDAFVGALSSSLAAGCDLETSLRRATCAGGLACTMAGAQEASPSADAIDARVQGIHPTVMESWSGLAVNVSLPPATVSAPDRTAAAQRIYLFT